MLINKIVVSDKFEYSDTGFKQLIGQKDDNSIRPLRIILPEMSGYIKYFDNGRKKMSLMIGDDNVFLKHYEIGTKLKSYYTSNFMACLFIMKNT